MGKNPIASIPFKILKMCGLWRPVSFTGWKVIVYNVYSCIVFITLVTIAIFVLLAVCAIPFTHELFAETVFLMFALFNATFKATNILISRKRFLLMLDMLQEDNWRELNNTEEIRIQEKYLNTSRNISKYFTIAVFIAIVLRCVAPLLDTSGSGPQLPVLAFCPCDITSKRCYWILYWHQAIGTGVATLTHAAKDCLINALLLQTCAQLDILKVRIRRIPEICEEARICKDPSHRIIALEKKLISACVKDHQSIFELARVLNESLEVMLFGQIAVTLPNLCLSIFLLSKTPIASIDFMMTVQFFSAVVIELFFFCWYGNEVTLHSLDVETAVNEMNWETLSVPSRKDLIMLMVRTSRPILFRVGPIMNMNVVSFLSIMKSSYSAFSVLQSTGDP
ncbi:hypothetical protein QAD02_015619 [Eretmocerus hayati]|uniref:Uncharacterized protein n=1 Tax=Eretmocerus hayati TaxID=131215 RepID=A0ACC2P8S1_9HYME|nr:hypothetical protein QAD02_015619 [Eretmocerus hayati]